MSSLTSNLDPFFVDLKMALNRLQRLTIFQNPADHLPFEESQEACPQLVRETERLSKLNASKPVEFDQTQVLEKWNQLQTSGQLNSISVRDYKRFCWVPKIVCEEAFRELLVDGTIPVSLPALRGLLYCYHEHFNKLCSDRRFGSKIREVIQARANGNATIKKWHNSINFLVGEKAPKNFADDQSDNWQAPEKALESFGLNSATEFASVFAAETARILASKFSSIRQSEMKRVLDDVLGSRILPREVYKYALSEIILSSRPDSDDEVQSLLIDFVLRAEALGDPRINPENWAGVSENAKAKVIQWLSREDINFFFELLLRDRDDKHGRKSFWLQYVDKVARSRALISKDDLRYHSVRLKEMEDKGRSYGELVGANASSAFILDFGRIVVVEFSEVGNACYIYQREAFQELCKNFWTKEFSSKGLKNQELVAERITRSMKDWQASARQILSRFGVRRG